MKFSIAFSKKILFSQSVSSASIRMVWRGMRALGCGSRFALAVGDFGENLCAELLQLAETRKVILKVSVQVHGFRGIEFVAQNHVAQVNWVRQHSLIAQFFERCERIV